MLSAFNKFNNNYLYELPEDIQAIIYRKLYQFSLKTIKDSRCAIDNYNKLIEYIKKGKDSNNNPIKNQAIWNIIVRRDVDDPYHKYFQYYADPNAYEADFLILNRTKMIRCDASFSSIKYIEFLIYPIQERVPVTNYSYIKNTFEQYIHIFLSLRHYNANSNMNNGDNSDDSTDIDYEYRNLKDILLLNDKIRIEFRDTYLFKCYIDIYNNILETYNFLACILDILCMFNNTIYPEYNVNYENDLVTLRDWFKYNAFFGGFTINDKGDTIRPYFYS